MSAAPKTRDEIDQMIWDMHLAQPPIPGPPPGYRGIADYEQMAEAIDFDAEPEDFFCRGTWPTAWGSFLVRFYRYKQASFFLKRPLNVFTTEEQALLAGTAEVLCDRFGLQVQDWVHDPQYVLPELWDPTECVCTDGTLELRISKAHSLYLRHRVIFADRNLLVV